MKKPKKTFLVNEEDLATIDYTEPQEDLFAGESIINAANKIIDFDQFEREQEKMIRGYNNQLMNLKIAAKKISDKYKKVRRKKKAASSVPSLHKISET